MFWRHGSRVSHVADAMPSKDFFLFFFFSDNTVVTSPRETYDVLYIHSAIPGSHLTQAKKNSQCRRPHVWMSKWWPFKGKSKKPKKWGYNQLILCGSNGIRHNFEQFLLEKQSIHLGCQMYGQMEMLCCVWQNQFQETEASSCSLTTGLLFSL